jgi:hypothetical protein
VGYLPGLLRGALPRLGGFFGGRNRKKSEESVIMSRNALSNNFKWSFWNLLREELNYYNLLSYLKYNTRCTVKLDININNIFKTL